ncbi:MAG TPA: hypothetical protein VIF62_01380 [Labilithrix sp.]|jgi:hypothetical protein
MRTTIARVLVAFAASAAGVAACTSFSSSSSDVDDAGVDAGDDGAVVDGTRPDGVAPGDGSDGDGDAGSDGGPTCTRVIDVVFSSMPAWVPFPGDAQIVFDTAQTPGGVPTLHATVSDGMAGGIAYLQKNTPVDGGFSSVEASYSLYIPDWGSAIVEPGCTLGFLGGTLEFAELMRESQGTIEAEIAGGGLPKMPLFSPVTPGWYDVTVAVTGVLAGNMETVTTMRARADGGTATKIVTLTFSPTPVTTIELQCGLMSVGNGSGPVDTWIDHVTMDVCP